MSPRQFSPSISLLPTLLLVICCTQTTAYPVNSIRQPRYISSKQVFQQSIQGTSHISKLITTRSSISYSEADIVEISPSPTSGRVEPLGYILDPCFYHTDCVKPRLCIRSDWEGACAGSANCICMAEMVQMCDHCTDCIHYNNESCIVARSSLAEGLCVSTFTVWEGITSETDCDSYPEITPMPDDASLLDSNELQKVNFYQVEASPSVHSLPSNKPSPSGSPSEPSNPVSPSQSSSNNQDLNSATGTQCIDSNLLKKLSSEEKVYKQDRRASVLCDNFNSCATPGHMVVVSTNMIHDSTGMGQQAMTMQSYCSKYVTTGCSKRVMNVNSPKFKRGLRLPSKASHLQFTAFAASYLTPVEEYTLRTLIHIGL